VIELRSTYLLQLRTEHLAAQQVRRPCNCGEFLNF
jgi:hypothetical protein